MVNLLIYLLFSSNVEQPWTNVTVISQVKHDKDSDDVSWFVAIKVFSSPGIIAWQTQCKTRIAIESIMSWTIQKIKIIIMTCIFNQCHNYNELHPCCSKLIHTFFWVDSGFMSEVCSRSSMNIVLRCGRCILGVNISWDSSGSVGEFATSAMTWLQRWKTSCCLCRKFLPVITSSCTLFFSLCHFPNSPAVLVKAHSSAKVTKYCTHQLPCT